MNIEEKAKAYDEALEKAKECHEKYWQVDAKFITETLFPELRENEDERIRKALIDALKVSETIGELKFRLPYPTREECITYLEKQKEHHIPWYDYQKSKEAGYTIVPNEEYEQLIKQKEQKPAEWSEEDEKVYSRLLNHYESLTHCVTTADRHQEIREELNFLKSICPSWKPSEKQMNCLCAAVDAATRKHNESVSGYEPARVLKSLYEDLKKLM